MRTKLKSDVSRLVLAVTAMTAVLFTGVMLTGHASAQAPAAAKQQNAGEAFKNVTTTALKGLTVDDFMGAMGVISADLGLDCADCHPGAGTDKANFVIDTPQKITAPR
jgi:putative exporter of polyketide antibiotics